MNPKDSPKAINLSPDARVAVTRPFKWTNINKPRNAEEKTSNSGDSPQAHPPVPLSARATVWAGGGDGGEGLPSPPSPSPYRCLCPFNRRNPRHRGFPQGRRPVSLHARVTIRVWRGVGRGFILPPSLLPYHCLSSP